MVRLLSLAAVITVASASVATKESPIRKIVTLLQDMVKQLQSEKEDDDAVWAKLDCWCKKNDQEQSAIRAKAVADYDAAIASAKEAFGEMQELEEKRNRDFTSKSDKAKEEAVFRETCTKEAKEFSARDIELKETIKAAKTAVTILKGGQSFLQTKKSELQHVMAELVNSAVVSKMTENRPEDLVTLQSFFDTQSVSFLQQPVGYESYASQSGGVIGMLSQMITDLDKSISSGAKAEEERRQVCKEKLAALNEEIAALGESIDTKDKRIGELAADNADAKAAADEARTTRLNAQEFLGKLGTQCKEAEEQYNSRTVSRADEMKACSETIEILDNDVAFKAFGKTVKKTETGYVFLQGRMKTVARENGASTAVWALDSTAKTNSRIFLVQTMIKSAAAQSAKEGVFDKVIQAVDDLTNELKAEQAQEVVDRDDCIATENELKRNIADTKFHLKTAQDTSEELEGKITMLTKDIEDKEAAIVELNKQVAQATAIREEGAKDFAVVQSDQTETQAILQRAIDRMSQVYKSLLEQPGADVVEYAATADTPGSAAAAFTKGGETVQNEGGNKVVNLLTRVLNDSRKELANAEQAENDAIAQYKEFMRVAERDLKALNEGVATKTERRVNAKQGKANADSDSDMHTKTVAELVGNVMKTQKSCGFLINNFTVRQQKRTEEIESLATAKQYLQGMN